VIIRTLDNTSKFLRRNLKRGGGKVDPITYPINSVRSPFINGDFAYWIERGKSLANANDINNCVLFYRSPVTASQAPVMRFGSGGISMSLAAASSFNLNADRSISFWLNKKSHPRQFQAVVTKDNIATFREWQIIYLNDGSGLQGQLVLSVFNSTPAIIFQVGAALSEYAWQHWVFNYQHSTATVTIYRNGVSVASRTITGTPNTTPQAVFLGAFGDDTNQMDGYISQIILANRTFTVSEINTLYNSGNGYFTI
jgi:hypothetical protein